MSKISLLIIITLLTVIVLTLFDINNTLKKTPYNFITVSQLDSLKNIESTLLDIKNRL